MCIRCPGLQRTDLQSNMATEAVCQQDRLQLLSEKRKWQMEIENKKRQLEDDRRALQHLKSKALRERWLLDGAPAAGPEQDEVRRQLEQDEAKTRTLEDTINRLEQELVSLETAGMCETTTHTAVSSGPVKAVEVKGRSHQQEGPADPGPVVQEVKVHKSPRVNKPTVATEEMKRAMYSVEIKVERDRLTGETRVLSTNTTLPVDLSLQGVKVYEDDLKVVHEVNGEDGVQLLSFSEVEELIHKADEASVMSQTVTTVTSLPTAEVQEEAGPEQAAETTPVTTAITGLEAKAGEGPSLAEASAENPVTMVFMGYQNVEDEDETKKVLGLQGTVKAELVLIDDADGKTSPGEEKELSSSADTAAPPPPASAVPPPSTKPPPASAVPPPSTKPPPASAVPPPFTKPPPAAAAANGETAGEVEEAKGGAVEVKKEKQPCKCCSIM